MEGIRRMYELGYSLKGGTLDKSRFRFMVHRTSCAEE